MDDRILLHWYDYDKGWEHTNPNWYEHQINVENDNELLNPIMWLYENIDNPERHCRWISNENKICVRFRHEKDYIWFRLTW